MQCSHAVISTRGDPPRGLRDSLHRPEPKRDRREISLNRPPTQTPQAGRQDRSAASCDDRRRRNPVVRPSIHPKPSKVMESEIRENHQVFRRVHILLVPHVLTEVSSFSRHIKNPARREVQAKLRRLIQTTTEIPIESIYGAEREEFEELGLTDA